MQDDRSTALATKSPKQDEIDKIADHIVETYRPFDAPIVLMWREVRNSFHLKLSPDHPVWARDDRRVHEDWNRYGKGVKRILEKRATVVTVSGEIRALVRHGHNPDLSGKRTEAAYRSCIPSSSSPTYGIAIFPRDAYADHPLIVESRKRRASGAATGVTNAIGSVRAANDLGNLSSPLKDEILGMTKQATDKAFVDDRYPLFETPRLTPLPALDWPSEIRDTSEPTP